MPSIEQLISMIDDEVESDLQDKTSYIDSHSSKPRIVCGSFIREVTIPFIDENAGDVIVLTRVKITWFYNEHYLSEHFVTIELDLPNEIAEWIATAPVNRVNTDLPSILEPFRNEVREQIRKSRQRRKPAYDKLVFAARIAEDYH